MGKKAIMGQCRLCLQQGTLVDSHIIPKFNLKPLKEEAGHFYVISTDPQKKERKEQKGLTEYLFCPKCDNERLQKNETHLAQVLFGGVALDGKQNGRLLTMRGYDYRRVKNGLLSILWRASISSLRYFNEVDLGPRHEERIRLALLNDVLIPEDEYPILLTAPFFEEGFLDDWILQPDVARLGMNRIYRCLVSGFLFTFVVGQVPLEAKFAQLILRQDHWPIVRARVEELPFLRDACYRLGQANAIRGDA